MLIGVRAHSHVCTLIHELCPVSGGPPAVRTCAVPTDAAPDAAPEKGDQTPRLIYESGATPTHKAMRRLSPGRAQDSQFWTLFVQPLILSVFTMGRGRDHRALPKRASKVCQASAGRKGCRGAVVALRNVSCTHVSFLSHRVAPPPCASGSAAPCPLPAVHTDASVDCRLHKST